VPGLGLAFELLQFFLASGISQGLSVLSRALGVAGGAYCWRTCRSLSVAEVQDWLRRLSLAGGTIYLLLLAYVNGYFSLSWGDWVAVREQWDAIQWLPFYYHYYTTEMVACKAWLLWHCPMLRWPSWPGPGSAAPCPVLWLHCP